MKKILKTLLKILIIPYIIVVLFTTTCLLYYNDYNITEFGDNTLIIMKDDALEPNYNKGSLIVANKGDNDKIKTNDYIFFYNTYEEQVSVNYGKVTGVQIVSDTETTYMMEGDYPISGGFVIGNAKTSKVYNNVGAFLSVIESKWGFLFIVVFPILLAFIYEIYAVVMEIKHPIDEK